jgi:hypothetical protein
MAKSKLREYVHFGHRFGQSHGVNSKDPEALAPSRVLSGLPELPRPTSTRTSVQNVLNTVHAHLTDNQPEDNPLTAAHALSAQPKFDDLTLYDVSEEEEGQLWECEVTRVVGAVKQLGDGLEFQNDAFLQPDSKAGYEDLSRIADHLLVNVHICRYDNEILLRQFSEKNVNKKRLNTSQRILTSRLDSTEDLKGFSLDRSRSFIMKYCALVDYITAVASRLSVTAADDETWQRLALSGLAKYSAKLKILVRDSEEYALRSVGRGKQLAMEKEVMDVFGLSHMGLEGDLTQRPGMGGHGMERMMEHSYIPWSHSAETSRQQKELEAILKTEDPSEGLYFAEMALVNGWTSSTLIQIIQALKASALSGLSIDGFDICSVVYKAGTIDSPLQVFIHQDRDGQLFGYSHQPYIRHSYLAFSLVQQAVEEIRKKKNSIDEVKISEDSLDPDDQLSDTRIMIQMDTANAPSTTKPQEIALKTISQVITVMVPLLCTTPTVIEELQGSLRALGELRSIDVEDKLSPARVPDFTAIASLRTRSFETQSVACLPAADFRSLSMSLVTQPDRQASHSKIPIKTSIWDNTPVEQRKQRMQEVQQRREKLMTEGQEWHILEESVRVKCPKYVYTVLFLCGVLALGGLMGGIFIGGREKGALKDVDPFNIATFSWVLAGFIILIAKSIRVNDWPWRDFILGRVTCRSLSELAAVTQANEQDLILYLLTKESENVLITKGPYNKMFTRKVNATNGFSIDIKPEVRTLVAAGLVFVKISMSEGSALVCLDLRRGSEKREVRTAVRHTDGIRQEDLVCRYPPRPGDKIQDVELSQSSVFFYHLRSRKIMGIYHAPERKVR